MAVHAVDLSPSISDYSYELLGMDAYRDDDLSVPESGDIQIALPSGVEAVDGEPLTAELTVSDPDGEAEDGEFVDGEFVDEEEEPTFTSTTTPGFTAEVVDSRIDVHLPMDLLGRASMVSLSLEPLDAYDSGQSLGFNYYLNIAQDGEALTKPVLSLAPTLYTNVVIDTDIQAMPGDAIDIRLPETSDLRSKGFDHLPAKDFRLELVDEFIDARDVPLEVNSDGSAGRTTIPADLDPGVWNLSFIKLDHGNTYNTTIVDATITVGGDGGDAGDGIVPVPAPAVPPTPPTKPAPTAGQKPTTPPASASGTSSSTKPGATTKPGTNAGLHSDTGVEDDVPAGFANATSLALLVGGTTLAATSSFVLLRRGRRLGRV